MKNFKQKVVDNEHKDRALHAPKVTHYMANKLITFTKDTEILVVIESLLKNKITGAPVLDEKGVVLGIIDDKDCLNVVYSSAYNNYPVGLETVENYMSTIMKSITPETDVVEAASIFLRTTYKRLLVLDDEGKLVGQISRRDVLRAVKDLKSNTW